MPRIDHSTARWYAELPKKPTHTIAGLPFLPPPLLFYMFPPSFSCILPLAMTLPALVGRISNWAESAMERPSAGGASPCGHGHSTQA